MDLQHSEVDAPPPTWEIELEVVNIASEQTQIPADRMTPDSRILEDLGMDSLAIVEFLMSVEEAYNVTLLDEEAETLFTDQSATLRGIAHWVLRRWGTGKGDSKSWTDPRRELPVAERAPFTQWGGAFSPASLKEGELFSPISPNREGYEQYRRVTDGMRCVLLPKAEAWIGSDAPDALPDQQPFHRTRLSAFLIDSEPVSTMAYCRFLNSIGKIPRTVHAEWFGVGEEDRRKAHFPLSSSRRGWQPIRGTEHQPMILVSWYGANAYALWANLRDWRYYRGGGTLAEELLGLKVDAPPPPVEVQYSFLPTEAQWEFAARGESQGGEEREAHRMASGGGAVVARHRIGADYAVDELPAADVNERRGMSPFGLHHMSGNVWQWCRDWYHPEFYSMTEAKGPDPLHAHPTGIRSERGGSWVGPEQLAVPSYRRGRPPAMRGRCLGFRCISLPEDLP